MDWPSILAKIAGAVLLAGTIRSIFKHVKEKRKAALENKPDEQSTSERMLNNVLLYLWLAFMVVFSTGMIVNN